MENEKPRGIWPTNKIKPQGTVKRNVILNPGQPEGKVFSHIELGLDGIQFQAGDVCGIVPVNDPKQIDHLLQALGIDASQKVKFGAEEITAGDLFKNKIEIVRATDGFLKLLDTHRRDGRLASKDLHMIEQAFGDKAVLEGLKANALADLIEHFGVEGVTVEDLVATHKKLTPRLYTASSSPLMHPDEVHMTVARVDYEVPLGDKKIAKRGVATSYMDGMENGHQATFFMQAKKSFHLPDELDKPIVMIGPGTGIAPFRAFAQEIEASGKKHSDVVLYSGGQYEIDALYREELQEAHRKGVLTEEPHYAISREGKKQRVQKMLESDSAHLRELVRNGAIFYICGGEKMGEEVVETLKHIAPKLAGHEKERIKMDVY